MRLERYDGNPILSPGDQPWRGIATMNPGAVLAPDGRFYLMERAVASLAPLYSHVGLWQSTDGFNFEPVVDQPVFSADMLGTPRGTVEDPRVVRIDGRYAMTYVHRNYASSCFPNGYGVPDYHNPPDVPKGDPNNYRTGIAVSDDLITWEDLGLVTPPEIDDRDGVLFSEKIGGRYAMLRRPQHYDGPQFGGIDKPSIWISYSDDLKTWSDPDLVAQGVEDWEERKIGAGATPMPTDAGWLLIYHGVDEQANYNTGVMLLDRENPQKVIARSSEIIMTPEFYYERVGLIIPRVVFPSANIIKDGTVFIYYGCCDTCISVATVPLDELLSYVKQFPV